MKWAMLTVLACSAVAQPSFEVASVKPADPNLPGSFSRLLPGGRLEVTHMSVRDLIGLAWNVQPFQISGGPAWVESSRFDIEARPQAGSASDPERMRLMLQSLLAARFQLNVRHETKELPIYALVFARKDRRLGPSLVESKPGGCTDPDPTAPLPNFAAGELPPSPCGTYYVWRGTMRVSSMTLQQLGRAFERSVGRPVVDRTGDTRKFDLTMRWSPNDDSFFTGLEDELGLKLEAQKDSVETIVIERAEKPEGN